MTIVEAILLAVIEGLTEFLPVSSTGHMIIAEEVLGIEHSAFTKAFTVNIQFGAILSVVVLYWKRFFSFASIQEASVFYLKLFVAFLPAALIGLWLDKDIDHMLGSVLTVAVSLTAGGIVLLVIDRILNPVNDKSLTYRGAFGIGLFQCISMIPGVSRSAATIIGGMSQGLTRKKAAEFSFFLAVPTMLAASGYKLLKGWDESADFFSGDHLQVLLVGNAVAFLVAMVAIKFFISVLTRHGFRAFGWYRIALGLTLIILLIRGVDLHID